LAEVLGIFIHMQEKRIDTHNKTIEDESLYNVPQ